MTSNLVVLSFAPGIQRDGTTFQGDMCSDGQWVRFQRGRPKKMGGMVGAETEYALATRASCLLLSPTGTPNRFFLYIANNVRIFRGTIASNLVRVIEEAPVTPAIAGGGASILWQSTTVIRDNVSTVVFMQTNNMLDITQTAASTLYAGPLNSAEGTGLVATAIPAEATGGMCYSAPYLFIYGTNGYVRYSRTEDPLNFAGGTSGGFTLPAGDKVIYAANIRGGGAAPSLLFWTLSSVVRVSNVGDAVALFKSDMISSNSSIMSSRSVIEYDGLFFWPGVDRFFNYNGVVDEMVNTTNLNYFFDNVDMNKRQLVFGVKNQKYGEMWWFYPEIANAGDAAIGCTRAIIYNKKENSWYDTAIARDCGLYSPVLGAMCTHGRALVEGADPRKHFWRHEVGYSQNLYAGGGDNFTPIPSSFTTPIFSWASNFSPTRAAGTKGQPIDRWIELKRIEPDFRSSNRAADAPLIQMRVNTREYASSAVVTSDPVVIYLNRDDLTPKIDMRVQGRQMSLTFSSNFDFELGNVQMLVGIGDGR